MLKLSVFSGEGNVYLWVENLNYWCLIEGSSGELRYLFQGFHRRPVHWKKLHFLFL